jgi:hypothetical protein
MDYIYSVAMTVACLLLLVQFRNGMVLHIRRRALGILAEVANTAEEIIETMNSPSYYAMVFDLTKWSFKQFYPTLANEKNREGR